MIIVNELQNRAAQGDMFVHASTVSGKVRVSTFTYTAQAGETDKTLLVAKLPAGRARVLPTLSRIRVTGESGTFKVGTLAYMSTIPGMLEVAQDLESLSATKAFADGATAGLDGPVNGVEYNSLDDVSVVVTLNSPLTEGTLVEGAIFFNVT